MSNHGNHSSQRIFDSPSQVPGIITTAELMDLKNGLQYRNDDLPPRMKVRPKKQNKQKD